MNHNNKAPDQGHGYLRSRVFLIGAILLLMGLITMIRSGDITGATKVRKDMTMTVNGPGRYAAKPPIDLSVPAKTETATFALG